MNEEQQLFVNCLWGTEKTTDITSWVKDALVVYKAVKHFEVLTCNGSKLPSFPIVPDKKIQSANPVDVLESYLKNLKLEVRTKREKE